MGAIPHIYTRFPNIYSTSYIYALGHIIYILSNYAFTDNSRNMTQIDAMPSIVDVISWWSILEHILTQQFPTTIDHIRIFVYIHIFRKRQTNIPQDLQYGFALGKDKYTRNIRIVFAISYDAQKSVIISNKTELIKLIGWVKSVWGWAIKYGIVCMLC